MLFSWDASRFLHRPLGAAILTAFLIQMVCGCSADQQRELKILNVSYDPTREFYEEINPIFTELWQEKTGQKVHFYQSHGGSGKQARGILDGLSADIATLALSYDIDQLYIKGRLIPQDWQARLPYQSAPYTSTIVFVVRKGNPKGIYDWGDLTKKGVTIITPNPKTSGGARWNYLAAWAYAQRKFSGDDQRIINFMSQWLSQVAVLDTGARGATTTFMERGIGDVLISWENEAFLARQEIPKAEVEIVTPSISVLAEPPVTVVDENARKHGVFDVAVEFLKFLYTEEAQEIAARHFFRPRSTAIAEKYAGQFKSLELVTIENFGGWSQAQATHFAEGGTFDQIYAKALSKK